MTGISTVVFASAPANGAVIELLTMANATQYPLATHGTPGAVRLATAADITGNTDDLNRVVTVGAARATQPTPATTTASGVVRLGTAADITGNTDDLNRVVTVGAAKATQPTMATRNASGVVRLATAADITGNTDDVNRVVTVGAAKATQPTMATRNASGVVRLATAADIINGTDDENRVVTVGAAMATLPTMATTSTPGLVRLGTKLFMDNFNNNVVTTSLLNDPEGISIGSGGWGMWLDADHLGYFGIRDWTDYFEGCLSDDRIMFYNRHVWFGMNSAGMCFRTPRGRLDIDHTSISIGTETCDLFVGPHKFRTRGAGRSYDLETNGTGALMGTNGVFESSFHIPIIGGEDFPVDFFGGTIFDITAFESKIFIMSANRVTFSAASNPSSLRTGEIYYFINGTNAPINIFTASFMFPFTVPINCVSGAMFVGMLSSDLPELAPLHNIPVFRKLG